MTPPATSRSFGLLRRDGYTEAADAETADVVLLNTCSVRDKAEQKVYYRHSTYPGGIYSATFSKLHGRFPGRVLEKAVKGMLPKGPLGYAMLKKLKVYAGSNHPHSAQQPQTLNV